MDDKPRQVLRDIVRQYGTAISADRARCSGLLRDLCGTHRAEIAILIAALEEGVPASLAASSSSASPAILLGRLVKQLQEDRLLTQDAAQWAVESWALALGAMAEEDLPQPKPVTPFPSAPLPPSPSSSSAQPSPLPQKNHAWAVLAIVALLLIGLVFIKNQRDQAERSRQVENARLQSEQAARDLEKARQDAERTKAELAQLARETGFRQQQAELEMQRKQAEIERLNAQRAAVTETGTAPGLPPPAGHQRQADYYIRQMLDASARGDEAKIIENKAIVQGLPKPARGNKKLARKLNAEGLEYVGSEQFEQAVEKFGAAHVADAGDVEIANNLGYALLKSRAYGEAETALLETLALDPGRANGWGNLAFVLAKQGSIGPAVACFDNAYRFSRNPQKTHQLFLGLIAQEDDANTKAALEQATRQAVGRFVAAP